MHRGLGSCSGMCGNGEAWRGMNVMSFISCVKSLACVVSMDYGLEHVLISLKVEFINVFVLGRCTPIL